MSIWRWLVGAAVVMIGRILRRRRGSREDAGESARETSGGRAQQGRAEPEPPPERRTELLVAVLLLLGGLSAAGFVVVYAEFSAAKMPNELLGACIALSLTFIALALALFAHRLVPIEELEEDYPREHPEEQREVAEIVARGGSKITRKRLLIGTGSVAGGALGLATLAPVLSLGPLWYTAPLFRAPWRRGTRLVDESGRPLSAATIQEGSYYTAFPEKGDRENIGAPLVVVRVQPSQLRLPAGRAAWAPLGILAYSKICTHAGCAVALYRKPTFRVVEPESALVCPCHYSTFNPATGGSVIFGPAGRPLPQLPLMIDAAGNLRAAGNFSGPVGPSWWGVRLGRAK
jgi:ubiquinol-cytochrome c reductase iron-sulfur subunit